MANNQYKIQVGVDLKVNDIRDRIKKYNTNKNNAKLKLGVSLDPRGISDQIKKINLKTPVKLNLNLNVKDAQNKINNIRNQIQQLGNIRINLGGTTTSTNSSSRGGTKKAVNDMNWAYRQMLDIQRKANSLSLKINGLDTSKNVNELKELSLQFARLKSDYETLKKAFGGQLSTVHWGNLQAELDETSAKLSAMDAKFADTRTKLANGIKLKIADGTFSNDISNIESRFKRLSVQSNDVQVGIDEVKRALTDMSNAAKTGNIDKMIAANERYERSLKSVENQLNINNRVEKDAADAQKLTDNRSAFQSNIDAWLTKNSAAAKRFGSQMLELKAQAESCDQVTLNHLKTEFKRLDKEAEAAGLRMQTLGDRIKTQFARYSSYFSVASLFIYATQGLRDMFNQVVAIDSAMTELKKVTNETDASYNQFLNNAAKRSKEIGTTIDGLVSSTADFARLGYGFKDAQGLAEVANIYTVVGDEIDGVEEATQSLISTLAAFKDEMNGLSDSDFAMSIVDKFNEVSNNFAISSGGIGEALQRSASSMAAANNTLDETIALITAANTVVQDADSVGTAFKTISMRIRGAKTELEDAGLETDGMVESTAKLREEILALTGVDIMDGANQFKSTYAIMDELAQKWKDLTDIQQATVTELIAGKRQGNIVSSLMSNFDVARDALETSLNSSGSAMKEHEKWQQSLEARINKLKSTWQSLAQSFMGSDFLKTALDAVIGLVNGLDWLIDKVGTLPTLFAAFTAFKSFGGNGFFKIIEDEASIAGKKIVSIFNKSVKEANNVFNSIGLKTNSAFKTSLNADIEALNNWQKELSKGAPAANAFNNVFEKASVSAKEFAKSGDLAAKGVNGFIQKQKEAQVSILAQNKSLSNSRAIIREYYSGCQNAGMSQKSFSDAVSQTNPSLGEQLKTAKNARSAFAGYTASLVGAKVAAVGLQIATMAMNAAITMGVSFLVSKAISWISKLINREEELAEKVEEVTSKFKEQQGELVKNQSAFESEAQRYVKLSKGVDRLGRNVSLTAEEYEEYRSVVNSIASQVPSLVSGYNEQGDAILNCKSNVEELTDAYNDLIIAANQSVLNEGKNTFKDFQNKMEDVNKTGFWDSLFGGNDELTSTGYDALKNILNSDDLDKAIEEYAKTGSTAMVEIVSELEALGIEQGKWESGADFIKRAVTENKQLVESIVGDFKATLEENMESIRSLTNAYFSSEFLTDYSDISDFGQDIINQMLPNLDADFYSQFDNVDDLYARFKEMLDSLRTLDDGTSKEIEAAFDLQTKFNGGKISYGEYVDGVERVGDLIDKSSLDEEIKNQIKLSLDIDEDGLVNEYKSLLNRLTETSKEKISSGNVIGLNKEKAEEFIDSLSSDELHVITQIIPELDAGATIEQIQAAINREMAVQGLTFDLNLEVETASIEAFNTALAESVSATGLSSESIAALKGRYADLESEGYNLSAMFEETSNGIHLNKKAVNELEQAYAKQKQLDIKADLEALKKEYNNLTTDIENCTGAERASLYVKRDAIIQKINDAATLAAQYEGLTSAYNDWLVAEEAGQERDMYENIISGFETIDDELSRGWIDDGAIEFLELLTGRTDLAGKSGKQLKEIYDDLDGTIKNTTYSVRDFFTVDEDGNSTNTGVYNFLDAIGQLEEEKFGGKDVVKRDDNGNIVGFDFELVAKKDKNGNVIKNGDQVIAEALGISEELVQIMVRASDDAGFVVNLEGTYTQLADLKTEAETARDTLISLQKSGLQKLKGFDVNFDLDADGQDLIDEQAKAVKLLDKFRKDDGTIDLTMKGAQQALDIAEFLTIKMDDLTEPKYMQIDTSAVDEDLKEPIEKMQEFERLSKEKHLLTLTGDKEGLKEVNAEMTEIAESLEGLDKETKIELGIDGLTSEEIAEKLEKGEIEIPAELNVDLQMSDDLKDMRLMMMNQLGLVSDNEVKLKVGFDIDESVVDGLTDEQQEVVVSYVIKNKKEFDKYTEEEKETVVKLVADGVDLDNYEAEDKEAIVNYIANGEEADGWTPEAKDAFVKYLVDGGEPNKFDPENKDSWVVYDTDTTEPDSYDPNDPTATVTYEKDSSDVDDYDPPNFIRTVTYKIKKFFTNIFGGDDDEGGSGVNGTANVNGTTGRAFKQGSWGTKNSGTALVGELGRETLVRDGRYYTIGNNGAEFIRYQRGDIIFNHRQTEELFANGKVTSGGGRGRALVSGTAFSRGTGGGLTVADARAEKIAQKAAEKAVKKISNNSLKTSDARDEKIAQKAAEKAVKNVTNTPSSTGGSSGTGGTGAVEGNGVGTKEDVSKFEETFDWVEIAISRIERAISRLDQKAGNIYKSWSSRNEALTSEIGKVREEIDLQEAAYNRYIKAANSVGLSESYAKKVREGTIDVEEFAGEADEKLVEKIKEYQQW